MAHPLNAVVANLTPAQRQEKRAHDRERRRRYRAGLGTGTSLAEWERRRIIGEAVARVFGDAPAQRIASVLLRHPEITVWGGRELTRMKALPCTGLTPEEVADAVSPLVAAGWLTAFQDRRWRHWKVTARANPFAAIEW